MAAPTKKDAKTSKVIERTFNIEPEVECGNCVNKIKGNMRFEKGVKRVETAIGSHQVTISYDTTKTTPSKLSEALAKLGYQAK